MVPSPFIIIQIHKYLETPISFSPNIFCPGVNNLWAYCIFFAQYPQKHTERMNEDGNDDNLDQECRLEFTPSASKSLAILVGTLVVVVRRGRWMSASGVPMRLQLCLSLRSQRLPLPIILAYYFNFTIICPQIVCIPKKINKRWWWLVCFTHKMKGLRSSYADASPIAIHRLVSLLDQDSVDKISCASTGRRITIKCGLEKNFANWLIKCVCPVYIWLSFLLYFNILTM